MNKNMIFNITHHEYVTKHIMLSNEEELEVLEKYNLTKNKLPKIIKTDPIVEPSPNPEPTPNIPDEPDEPEPNNDLPPEPTPEPIGQEIIFTNIQTIKIDYKTYKVKWTTNVPEKSVLKFGTHPEALINIAYDEAEVSNHQITLNDLNVNTKYYFMIINQNSEGEYFTSDVESFETKA